jgi:holo-[acyl-carrier protein] synthase
MILGIGVDSVEIARVAAKCAAADSRFMEKMFTEREIARSRRNLRSPYQHLAACFAAREAFFKATQVWYMRQNASILQRRSGEPYYALSERVRHLLGEQLLLRLGPGVAPGWRSNLRVSLTHDEEYATAFTIWEALPLEHAALIGLS